MASVFATLRALYAPTHIVSIFVSQFLFDFMLLSSVLSEYWQDQTPRCEGVSFRTTLNWITTSFQGDKWDN